MVESFEKEQRLVDWAKEKGILFPKLEWPAKFDGGLLGVRAKEDINYREAFVFVPFNVMITLESARNSLIKDVLSENEDMFKEHNDHE